jgi:hypothetical protein
MAERTTEPQRFWAAGQFLVLRCCDRAVPVDDLPSQPRADIVAASAWGHDRLWPKAEVTARRQQGRFPG